MISKIQNIKQEVAKVVVGQEKMIDSLLIALLCEGHILIEGVPGLAKTTTVNALSKALGLSFKRAQFTPDLLPSDILGAEIYDPQNNQFKIKKGPIFTNLLLADEINRAPAKVQSALLEAMQEKQITLGETTYALPKPFLVMATQNPIEQEGTYPLPEAQVDRFMLKLLVDYPTPEEEMMIMDRMIEHQPAQLQTVLPPEQLQQIQALVKNIHMSPKIKEYIVNIIFATRDPKRFGINYKIRNKSRSLGHYIEHGASPRASLALNISARAYALIKHRSYVIADDIKSIAYDILRHRITPSYEAEADELNSDSIIKEILNNIEVP